MSELPLSALRVRRAKGKDLECIVTFNSALAWETERKQLDMERLRVGTKTLLNNPLQGFYVVAEMPDSLSVIGQLMVTFEWSDWRNGVFWWLQSVYVHQSWRNRGVFRQLYQFVLQEAEARSDVAGIRLYVEETNTGAQAVYKSLGLSPTQYRLFEKDFVL